MSQDANLPDSKNIVVEPGHFVNPLVIIILAASFTVNFLILANSGAEPIVLLIFGVGLASTLVIYASSQWVPPKVYYKTKPQKKKVVTSDEEDNE